MRRPRSRRDWQPAHVEGPMVDGGGKHTDVRGGVKAGLSETGAGNRGVDCNKRRAAAGGPMTGVIGDDEM